MHGRHYFYYNALAFNPLAFPFSRNAQPARKIEFEDSIKISGIQAKPIVDVDGGLNVDWIETTDLPSCPFHLLESDLFAVGQMEQSPYGGAT